MNNQYIFFILTIISYSIHINAEPKCKSDESIIHLMNYLHHVLSVYTIFGSFLFGYHKTHIILTITIIFIRSLYNFRCPITLIYNRICDINIETEFNDILSVVLPKNIRHNDFTSITSLIILYDLFFIFKTFKIK